MDVSTAVRTTAPPIPSSCNMQLQLLQEYSLGICQPVPRQLCFCQPPLSTLLNTPYYSWTCPGNDGWLIITNKLVGTAHQADQTIQWSNPTHCHLKLTWLGQWQQPANYITALHSSTHNFQHTNAVNHVCSFYPSNCYYWFLILLELEIPKYHQLLWTATLNASIL